MTTLSHDRGTTPWQLVLDGIEAEVVRTERWLTVTDGPALPADVVLGPELPALPALPDEARQRAGELHERIVRVMRDLKDSMDSNRRQVAALAVTRRHNAGSAPARFVDRSC